MKKTILLIALMVMICSIGYTQIVTTRDPTKVKKSGDTMTGPLTVQATVYADRVKTEEVEVDTMTGVAQIKFQDGSVSTSAFSGGGGGDMYRATYDIDENGVVDNSEALGGQDPTYYATGESTGNLVLISDYDVYKEKVATDTDTLKTEIDNIPVSTGVPNHVIASTVSTSALETQVIRGTGTITVENNVTIENGKTLAVTGPTEAQGGMKTNEINSYSGANINFKRNLNMDGYGYAILNTFNVMFGNKYTGVGSGSIGIGKYDTISGKSIGIGWDTIDDITNLSIGIGSAVFDIDENSVGIGNGVQNIDYSSIGIGDTVNWIQNGSIGMGRRSHHHYYGSLGIGEWTTTNSQAAAIAIGPYAETKVSSAIAIGSYCINETSYTVKFPDGYSIQMQSVRMSSRPTVCMEWRLKDSSTSTNGTTWQLFPGTSSTTNAVWFVPYGDSGVQYTGIYDRLCTFVQGGCMSATQVGVQDLEAGTFINGTEIRHVSVNTTTQNNDVGLPIPPFSYTLTNGDIIQMKGKVSAGNFNVDKFGLLIESFE